MKTSAANTIKDQGKKISDLTNLHHAVIIVLFVGFLAVIIALGGVVVDAFRSREGTYQDLANQIRSQNTRINLIMLKLNILAPLDL